MPVRWRGVWSWSLPSIALLVRAALLGKGCSHRPADALTRRLARYVAVACPRAREHAPGVAIMRDGAVLLDRWVFLLIADHVLGDEHCRRLSLGLVQPSLSLQSRKSPGHRRARDRRLER